jgi:hypothetical protein
VLGDTLHELNRLQTLHGKVCAEFNDVTQSARELDVKLKANLRKLHEAHMSACSECGANPAADTNALAMQLLPLEREVELLTDSADLLTYVRIPNALDAKLEVTRDLLRVQHLEASLYASHSHASMLAKLEHAGFGESHGRVVAISETTEKLKLVAAEAHRQAQLADTALTDQRAARITLTAARRASGKITRAEGTLAAVELARSTSSIA